MQQKVREGLFRGEGMRELRGYAAGGMGLCIRVGMGLCIRVMHQGYLGGMGLCIRVMQQGYLGGMGLCIRVMQQEVRGHILSHLPDHHLHGCVHHMQKHCI